MKFEWKPTGVLNQPLWRRLRKLKLHSFHVICIWISYMSRWNGICTVNITAFLPPPQQEPSILYAFICVF